jgi:hypothetical protein
VNTNPCLRCNARERRADSYLCARCTDELAARREFDRVTAIMRSKCPEILEQFAGLSREQVLARLNEPDSGIEV